MGSLKPNAKYIYEKSGGVTYAREFGSIERTIVGMDYDKDNPNFDLRTKDGRSLHDHIIEDKMWGEIRREARTNVALQKALDRAIMIYRLSKDNPI